MPAAPLGADRTCVRRRGLSRGLVGTKTVRTDADGLHMQPPRRRTRQITPRAAMLTVSVGDTTMGSGSRTSNSSKRAL